MNDEDANDTAIDLADQLRRDLGTPNFISIGVGADDAGPTLIVYVSKRAKADALACIPSEYENLPVIIKKTTPPRPAKRRPNLEW